MVSDPRCPYCDGKVSATATWCMHCGQDFETPVDADGGRVVGYGSDDAADFEAALDAGDLDGAIRALRMRENGPKVVGIVLGLVALVTVPLVSPAGVTLLYLAAAVGVGLYASRQPSVDDALRDGGTVLAVVPLVLWLAAALLSGFVGFGVLDLFGPVVYAGLVLFATRRMTQ
ncbi:hypothetical protein [Haloarcula pellucida]|nr:hypothetical protein [Halomicroarcula pellucida]MBX0350442.1 hypothetical protein [Halomicroarcula pellucida]